MKKNAWIAVFAALVFSTPVIADEHEQPEMPGPLSDVWLVVPKQGMLAQFDEAAKKHIAFRAKAGESRSWMAFRPVIGDKLNVLQYRSCCFEYADIDAHMAEEDKLGLGANWNANVDQYVDHYHHYLERTDWENSHWPDGSDGPYFGVTSWTWKEGVGPAAGEARKRLSQMAKTEGWADAGHNWMWLDRIGGKDILTIVTSYKDFADMAPDEQSFFDFVAEKAGSAEAASEIFTSFGSGFSSSDYSVWVHDADLSTPPKKD